MPSPTLSGPTAPAASGGKPKQLVVMLHGVGADGHDLIDLAPYFARALPDAEFVSPDAPVPLRHGALWPPVVQPERPPA